MGEKHLFVNAIIIKALFFFLACFITTKINAQSINFITTQNALPQLDERIVKAGNSFNIQILNQKLVSGKRYKLSLTIKGRGIELKSSPDWYPKPIDLNGEPILNLTSYDLAPYFDIENLDFTGYSIEDYVLQGGVPDGSYNVCFQLYDNTSDAYAAVGNKACVVMWAKKEDVPKITNPTRNPTIDQSIPYNFTWIPRHTSGGLIAYDFEIYEENASMSFNDIMLYNSPVLKTTTSTTSYLLNANNNILKRGRKYFCIVKANATLGGTVFKNGGYSEPEYFSYGYAPKFGRSSSEDQCATYYLCWEDFATSMATITSISLIVNGSPTQITFDPPIVTAGGYSELVGRTLEALDALNYQGGFVGNDPTIEDCTKGTYGLPGLFFTNSEFQFTSINGIPSGGSQNIQIPFNMVNAVDCDCTPGAPCTVDTDCFISGTYDASCNCVGIPIISNTFAVDGSTLILTVKCTTTVISWSTGQQNVTSITPFDPNECYSVSVTCNDGCSYVLEYGQTCGDCVLGEPCDDNDICTVNDKINEDCECTGQPVSDIYFYEAPEGLIAKTNCTSATFLWNTGSTSNLIVDFDPNQCYSVTVTCDLECILIGYYGEGCDCTPGTPCNDNNYCTENDVFNAQCECIGVPAETVTFSVNNNILSSTVSCEGSLEYLWSNGATTPTVALPTQGNPCYAVTITCDNGCTYVGNYGTDCGCVVGTPCPEAGPCLYVGVYDGECNCPEPTPLPDSDGDGICDELDPCPVGPNEDFDNDGIVDCTETEIDCGNFNPQITSSVIDPGSCDFMVNLDELLGNQSYINITNVNMHVGGQTYVIDETNSELPVCYGNSQAQSFTQSYDDFETKEINWNGLSPFVKRVENDILNGDYCMRLKGGSEFSHMSLPTFSIVGMNMVNINFMYVTEDFKIGEKFILQASYNNGQTYQDLQTYTFGSSFQNNVSQIISYNHSLGNQTQIKLRFINENGDESNSKLYIDEIKIIKSAATCNKQVAAEALRLIIEKWLFYSNQFSGTVSIVDLVVDPNKITECPNLGLQILVSDANIHFDLISGQNGINTGQESFCKLECQGEIVQGQESILSVSGVNCSNPTYLWSDGSTTPSITVNAQIAKYFVTVTCGNGCSKVLVNGTGGCAFGQACSDPCLVGGVGHYDDFCNCVGTRLLDSDGDGICDEEDPCPSDSNLNCAEPCEENSLEFTITHEDKTVCDKCVSINSFAGQNLVNVEISTPGGQINLSNEPGFSFPYCYELTESFCTSGEFLSNEYAEMASIKQFTFDFYLWAKHNNPNVFVKIDLTNGCSQNSAPSIIFGNVDFSAIKLYFTSGSRSVVDITPCKIVYDYSVLSVKSNTLPNCQPLSYLWSDGSTTPTIILRNKKAGASVTVTCPALRCPLTGIINEDYCIVGTPCNDYDECTVNDSYNNACLCVGQMDVDDDNDGVGNACDECPSEDDTVDVDQDGIPDCKEECDREEVEQCIYCVDLYPDNTVDCYYLNSIKVIKNGQEEIIYLGSDIKICPSLGIGLTNLLNAINSVLVSENIGGFAQLTGNACSPNGFSITVYGSNYKLLELMYIIPRSGSSSFYPFTETCVTVLETACDDGDLCTINDVYDEFCNCNGVFQDEDNDLVCDEYDVCPGYPDGLDINGNGVPDCQESSLLNCGQDDLPLCYYLINYVDCDKTETIDLKLSQDELILFMSDEDVQWQPLNFNIPELIRQLRAKSDAGSGNFVIPTVDNDGDGLINYLDPCPTVVNTDFIFNQASELNCCNDIFNDPIRNALLASWMYTPITKFYNNTPPPCFGSGLGQHNIAVREEQFDTADDVLLVFDGGVNNGASVKVTVGCDCNCNIECLHDVDEDGICDENDTDIIICDDPPCYPCVVPRYMTIVNGVETLIESPTGGCPDTDPCHYYVIEDCTCILNSYRDSDGDGICDILDQCEGPDVDVDPQNGIVDCLDLCPGPVQNHHANPDIIDPIGPGDACDDGNPCTYADALNASCYCEGVIVDVDDDGVDDCAECKVFFIDPDVVGAPAVEITTGGPYINCAGCYYVSGNINNPETKCDMCPGLPELDYNGNGVPDCLDPPYYEVGCPSGYSIIEGVGLVLIFDADKIRVEDIPNPIQSFGTKNSSSGNDLFTNEYLTISNTREVNGTYEVLYSYTELTGNITTLSVNFSGSQPCPLLAIDDPLVDIICPIVSVFDGNVFLEFHYPPGVFPDVFSFTGPMSFDLTSGAESINQSSIIKLDNISPFPSNQNEFGYLISLPEMTDSESVFDHITGSITLPNGIVCTYDGGVPVGTLCGEITIMPGAPCDCDPLVMDCACYTHFRYDNNCNCIGDKKPDFDGDGICDEFDPCPEEDNTGPEDSDGDGRLDCPCIQLQLAVLPENQPNPSLVNGNDVSISLDIPDPSKYTGATITITGGPALDPIDLPLTVPLIIPNLPKGYDYTITVTAQCATGGTASTDIEIEDVPFESNPMFCGISLAPIDPSTYTLLPTLKRGDVFKAANFNIFVQEASGSYGKFSGKGYIQVPYFNQLRVNVSFSNITVTADKQMIVGFILVSGYGVSVLGEPMSSDINEWTNEIINVLTDISEVLEVLIPFLEASEELVKASEQLLSEETKKCLEGAIAELKKLETEGLSTNPAPTPERQVQIVQEIKDWTIIHDDCKKKADKELEDILERLIEFIPYAVDRLANDNDPDICPSDYNQAHQDNDDKYMDQLIIQKDNIINNWLGTGTGQVMEKSVLVATIPASNPLPDEELVSFYHDGILVPEFCKAMDNLHQGFESTNLQENSASITAFLDVLVKAGDKTSDKMGKMIRENNNNSQIYDAVKMDLFNGFKKVLIKKSFK